MRQRMNLPTTKRQPTAKRQPAVRSKPRLARRSRPRSQVRLRSATELSPRYPIHTGTVFPPLQQTVSAILSVQNEEDSIGGVLNELKKLQVHEIIVILNGCTDRSYDIARQHENVKIVHYADPIGHDVGRAIGAKLSTSDILLFVDGDIPISANALMSFIYAVHRGIDVALNDISPFISTFDRRDDLTRCKEFLNRSLGRSDLTVNSMTAIPHALSRRAIEIIGYDNLMVPPKAQAIAMLKGLKIELVGSVNVIERNKLRKSNVGHVNPVAQMIIGDHLEAIRQAMNLSGNRLSLPDHSRKRIAASRNGI